MTQGGLVLRHITRSTPSCGACLTRQLGTLVSWCSRPTTRQLSGVTGRDRSAKRVRATADVVVPMEERLSQLHVCSGSVVQLKTGSLAGSCFPLSMLIDQYGNAALSSFAFDSRLIAHAQHQLLVHACSGKSPWSCPALQRH